MTGNRRWRLSLLPVLAFLLVLPALISLGVWQWQRGEAKAELHERFDAAQAQAFRDVTGMTLEAFNQLPRYKRIDVVGKYETGRHFLLDNMPRDGRPGHHVLTAFRPAHGDYLLIVDRGWRPGLAQDADDEIDKQLDSDRVRGMLAPFPRPAIRLEGVSTNSDWPKVVQFPDETEFARLLNEPVAGVRLLLDETAKEGFARDWKAPGIPAERHYAYAFQWFSLAVALIVIFIVLAWPRAFRTSEEENRHE